MAGEFTFGIGEVHVGKPVEQRAIAGVWECADNCPHSDHDRTRCGFCKDGVYTVSVDDNGMAHIIDPCPYCGGEFGKAK